MMTYEIISCNFWGGQLFLIFLGLMQMRKASRERDRIINAQLSSLEANMQALRELLRRSST